MIYYFSEDVDGLKIMRHVFWFVLAFVGWAIESSAAMGARIEKICVLVLEIEMRYP